MEWRRPFLWATLWGTSFLAFALVSPLDWWTGARFTALITGLAGWAAVSLTVLLVGIGEVTGRRARWFAAASGVLAAFSAATGLFNGQTFEAYTTPRYVGILLAGHDPYATVLRTHFTVCSGPTATALVQCVTHPSSTFYLYLPVLMFLQVPGVPYMLVTLLAWLGCLGLLWRDSRGLAAFGSPFVALLAANGYNDFPVFLLLTLGFVGWRGRRSKVAEYLALGAKQFANVLVLAYYVWKRDVRNAVLTLVVSVAFLVPFLLWNPTAVVCTVVFHRNPDCTLGPSGDLLNHLNYWAWPIWVIAAFHAPLLRQGAAAWSRRNGRRRPLEGTGSALDPGGPRGGA